MNSSTIKALITDDSLQARRLLKLLLAELTPEVAIVGEASNVDDAVEKIKKLQPDLVFLDIEMPGKSGLMLVEELAGKAEIPDIVFTTAYNQYAIQAFRLSAVDYLLKPIEENLLIEAVNKIKARKNIKENALKLSALVHNLKHENEKTLSVPLHGGFELLPVKDIVSFEADGSYTIINLINAKSILVSKNLKYFENQIADTPNFFRIHRSFLINLDFVRKVEKNQVELQNGAVVDLSRERKELFIQKIKAYRPMGS
ncbi:MAG: LytTR family DNA-binding domain-containing protein [Flavobacteriales bacterium]|nr:LytTR family DNA-binding domain-containing protein [Flavobacteriales bacterium]